MSTTIEETVRTTLNERGQSGYMDYARPVVEKLTERERDISEQLLTIASDLGADPDDIKAQLSNLGMAVPVDPMPEDDEPELTLDDDAIEEIRQSLRTITGQITSLTTFARRNGYTG